MLTNETRILCYLKQLIELKNYQSPEALVFMGISFAILNNIDLSETILTEDELNEEINEMKDLLQNHQETL